MKKPPSPKAARTALLRLSDVCLDSSAERAASADPDPALSMFAIREYILPWLEEYRQTLRRRGAR